MKLAILLIAMSIVQGCTNVYVEANIGHLTIQQELNQGQCGEPLDGD